MRSSEFFRENSSWLPSVKAFAFGLSILLVSPMPACAQDISLRVKIHPDVVRALGEAKVDASKLIDVVVRRAGKLLCNACLKDGQRCRDIKQLDKYVYTIESDVAELEERDEIPGTFGARAVNRLLQSAANGVGNHRVVYIVRQLTFCGPRPIEPGLRFAGCTSSSRSRIVLALGPPPYPLNEVPNPWLDSMAWALAHELGHTFGFG